MNRLYSVHDVIRQDVETLLMRLYTSIPAKVDSYNPDKQTVNVTIAVNTPTYRGDNIPASSYSNIPVVFPSASKWVIAGPLSKGDVVLLVVPHYGTKEFMAGGRDTIGDSKYVTRHDLNDAIAIPGMFTNDSVTRKPAHKDKFHIANGEKDTVLIEEGEVSLTSDAAKVEVTPTGVNVQLGTSLVNVSSAGVTLQSGASTIAVTPAGTTVTGSLIINGVDFATHTHP